MSESPKQRRILVVDDDPVNRMIATAILTRAGFGVDQAADGASALVAVSGADYDLVLMDLMMPDMDGEETTRRIRQLASPYGAVPILAWTAAEGFVNKERCLAAGMDGFLLKRTDRAGLLDTVTLWMNDHQTVGWGLEPRPGFTPPLVNRYTLAQVEADIGAEVLDDVLLTFSEDSARRLVLVAEAVAAGDWRRAADHGHALKGSAGTFGAMALRQVAAAIESAGMAGDGERLAALVPELQSLQVETLALLKQLRPV